MAMSLLLAQRVLVMFALAGVGFAMFRAGKITLEGNRTIGNILIYLSLPAVIIKSLMVGRTVENAVALAEGAGVALVLIVVAALVARLTCRRDGIGNFAGTFSNPSFFGIPLIAATIGEACVFYNAGFIFLMNIGQWTYGVSLLTGERERISWRDVLLAPFTIAMLVGLVLFSAQPPLPVVVTDCLGFVADLNTPLAMF
ncbi:MAG: AEC family transporter, partial [Olsenella sp.]